MTDPLQSAERIIENASPRDLVYGVGIHAVASALLKAEKERVRLVALYHEVNEFGGRQMNRADKAEAQVTSLAKALRECAQEPSGMERFSIAQAALAGLEPPKV